MLRHFAAPNELSAAILAESVGQRLLPRLRQAEMRDTPLVTGVPEGSPLSGSILRGILCHIVVEATAVWISRGWILYLPSDEGGLGIPLCVRPFVWVGDIFAFACGSVAAQLIIDDLHDRLAAAGLRINADTLAWIALGPTPAPPLVFCGRLFPAAEDLTVLGVLMGPQSKTEPGERNATFVRQQIGKAWRALLFCVERAAPR